MVTLIFTTVALLTFMEKASNDLLVEQRAASARRLRMEAYSALEVTLTVLQNFSEVTNGLHSPAEGWNDPLGFVGYEPSEGRKVEISFEDESGKISLPRSTAQSLTSLFLTWGVLQADAEMMSDALLGWMKKNHVYSSAMAPDYEQAALPYLPPARSLRSYHELAAIDKAREFFYDEAGRPNEYWHRFVDTVSLFDFARPNINGARTDTLAAIGQFEPSQQQGLTDYLSGKGWYLNRGGPAFFRDVQEAQRIAGATGNSAAFGTTISALRILVTVTEGRTVFKLSAVIAPPGGGATTIQTTATSQRTEVASGSNRDQAADAARTGGASKTGTANNQKKNAAGARDSTSTGPVSLKYPFTLLEIRENDEIPPPPPPPPADQPF